MSSKTPIKTEWRKKPVDRSKRVAYGCEIENKNIISGTRRRKDFNYKITADNYLENDESDEEVLMVENYVHPIHERKPRKSNNSIDKRIERYDASNPQSVKQLKETLKKKRKSNKENEPKEETKSNKKSGKKTEKRVEKKDEEESMEETKKEETKVEQKPEQVVKKRKGRKSLKNKDTKQNEGFPESCTSKLKELGATLKSRGSRKYKSQVIPVSIQAFLDHKFPEKMVLNNEVIGVSNLSFTGEYLLTKEEMDEYKFLRENGDAILIGEGDFMCVAKMSDKGGDFGIYFLDDENQDSVKGPYKISKFLADCTVGEAPEDDMEE